MPLQKSSSYKVAPEPEDNQNGISSSPSKRLLLSAKSASTRAFQNTGRKPTTLRRTDTTFSLAGSIDGVRYMHSQRLIKGRPWYIIHPHSYFCVFWDLCTSIALIYTAVMTVWEVSYLKGPPDGPWSIFYINRGIDLIFIIDMGLQFIIMQQVEFKKGADIDSVWEYRIDALARRYLRMWFWIDLFSVLPSAFDLIPVLSTNKGEESSNISQLKFFRIIRTLRLAKLVRLFRGSRVIERWETRIAIPYNLLTVCQLMFMITYTTHLFACILALMTTFDEPKVFSWYNAFGYCDHSNVTLPYGLETTTTDLRQNLELAESIYCGGVDAGFIALVTSDHTMQLYLQGVWWGLGLVLGFTAEPLQGPHRPLPDPERFTEMFHVHEQVVVLILQFLGAILWAYVTARLVDVIVNANPEATRFRQSIDELNRFCAFNKLPKAMEVRLREYYIKRKLITQAESRQQVAEGLSPMLQGEVAWTINAGWLARIPFLNHDVRSSQGGHPDPAMQQLRVNVALSLRPQVYAPNESPPDHRLYVIFNGLARYHGDTLKKGDHWGEWEVLLHGSFTRRARAKAINYLHVLTIDADTIKSLAEEFPEAYKYIRRWVGWRSLSEFLLDKLRRRRRNMHLLVKRWRRRWPSLFWKMRCFLLAIYLLLKEIPNNGITSSSPTHKHRGRLQLKSEHFSSTGKQLSGQAVSNLDDTQRLDEVGVQIQALLHEQSRLTHRIAARATDSGEQSPGKAAKPAVHLAPIAPSAAQALAPIAARRMPAIEK